jgi:hypothetical protein
MSLHILHQITNSSSEDYLSNLIQNLIIYDREAADHKLYILLDSAGDKQVLSAVQTLQQNFSFLIYSKVEGNAENISLAQELGSQNLLILKNNDKLEIRHLHFTKQLLSREISKNKLHQYTYRNINLHSATSLWQKFLLYWKT